MKQIVSNSIFTLLSLFIVTEVFGQSCDSTQWAQPGSYSVVIDSSAFESTGYVNGVIMLSENDLCYIESKRQPFVEVEIHLGIYLITIYPKPQPTNSSVEE